MLPVQPQPNQEFYDLSILALAVARTRQPGDPQFDPTRKLKSWQGSGTFFFFDGVGNMKQASVPAAEDSVNFLPAAYPPAPPIANTPAVRVNGGGAVDPSYLTSIQDAISIMAEMSGSDLNDDGAVTINYGTETRRDWSFAVAGTRVNAGQMIAIMNANGVGHPGKWSGTTWVSIPDPSIPPAGVQDWGIPYRTLQPNEQIVPFVTTGLGFSTYRVQRTDLTAAAPEVGGGMTSLQESKLDHAIDLATQNQAALAKITAALGLK